MEMARTISFGLVLIRCLLFKTLVRKYSPTITEQLNLFYALSQVAKAMEND